MGPYMTVDVCMSVDPRISVTASHQACERVRLSILATHPAISEVITDLLPVFILFAALSVAPPASLVIFATPQHHHRVVITLVTTLRLL
jgi:hypothetical protein